MPGHDTSKGPAFPPGLHNLRRLEKGSALRRLFLDHGVLFHLPLGATARPLRESRLDLLDRLGLGQPLHGRDLAPTSVEGSLIS